MEFSVIAWNIAEGSFTETLPPNSTIADIAKALAGAGPDFILLNEVKNWDGPFGWAYGGMNQASQLAQDLGMGYQAANVNVTGLTGHKAVAVLSKHLLTDAKLHEVSPGYGILEVTATVAGTAPIKFFSLRFDHADEQAKINGHHTLLQLVEQVGPDTTVIAGGDFNAYRFDYYFDQLVTQCALTPSDNFAGTASNPPQGSDTIDHVLSRGPATMAGAEVTAAPEHTTDHPWVRARFTSPTVEPAPTGDALNVPQIHAPVDRPAQLLVTAQDAQTNQPVNGDVARDGTVIGRTGDTITATFYGRWVWVGPEHDDRGHPIPGTRTRVLMPPITTLTVRASGYSETPVPIVWDGLDG